MKNLQERINRENIIKMYEVRIETINTLIATFGDEDGKLTKELTEAYKKLKKEKENEKWKRD